MKQIATHPSGLRIVTYEMPYMNSVSVGIWIGAGGRYESLKQNGMSHFIEHLLFKGTEKRDGKEISQAIEGLGGILNAFTGEEFTCYYSKVLSEYFEATFDVLWDMVTNNYFKADHIDKEKSVVKEEISMYLDLPAQYVHDLLSNIMWPDQPLGRILIGTEGSIDAMTNDTIVDYKNVFYRMNNIVVAVAGRLSHQEIYDTISRYVESGASQGKIPVAEAVVEKQDKPVSLIMNKDTEQTHFALGLRSFHRQHEDRYILKILNTILGENMSSRLFQTIREEHGLAYSIHSSIERFMDTGSLVISAGVEEKNLIKTVELVCTELRNLTQELVSDDELDRARKYAIGQLSLGLEKTMNIMLWSGENLLCTNNVPDVNEILDELRRVNKEDILRISRALFVDNNLNLSVIGPVKNKKIVEKALTVG
ncbi:MAG: pitrilysin family protein [Candidatus Auribacterota bacterium]